MVIGTKFIGCVDTVDGEWIESKFLVLGIPLIPLESFYVYGMSINERHGVRISSHPRSILCAYARWWGALCAIFGAFHALVFPSVASIAIPALGLLVMVFGLRLGKASATERVRRRVFRQVVGSGIPPEYLDEVRRARVLPELERLLGTLGVSKDWRHAVASMLSREQLMVLGTTAAYGGHSDLAADVWRRLADQENGGMHDG